MPTRDSYLLTASTLPELVTQLNFYLARIADRLDKLEGIRGSTDIATGGDVTVTDDSDEVIHSLE